MKTPSRYPMRYSNEPSWPQPNGVSFRELLSEALAKKLQRTAENEKPWMQYFGKLRNLHKETLRINKIMDEEFEQIEPETCAEY